MPALALPTLSRHPRQATASARARTTWLARLVRDTALWFRAPPGKRPDWNRR